jgi:hypothetical protein
VRVTDEDGTYHASKTVLADAPPTFTPRSMFSADSGNISHLPGVRGPVIRLTASESVGSTLEREDLVLVNLTTGASIDISSSTFAPNPANGQLPGGQWIFDAGLPDGCYEARIPAGRITDQTGNLSEADFILSFRYLLGDANNDGAVDFSDLLTLSQNYGHSNRSFSGGNFDYSADGEVGFPDLLILAQRYGGRLPVTATLIQPERRRVRPDLLT